MLQSAVLISLLAALQLALPEWRETRPPHQPQTEPGWLARKSDRLWRDWVKSLFREAQQTLGRLSDEFRKEYQRLAPGGPDSPEIHAEKIATGPYYGRLPEIFIDGASPAGFPRPLKPPARYSWARAAGHALETLLILDQIDRAWKELGQARALLSPAEFTKRYQTLAGGLEAAAAKAAGLAQEIQYLDLWIPLLEDGRNFKVGKTLDDVLSRADAEIFRTLQEQFKPRRTWQPRYLPAELPRPSSDPTQVMEIPFPIVTDVTDRRFRREVEASLETYWNDSGWARRNRIRFRIQWKDLPWNAEFAAGRSSLEEHLRRFPQDQAGLTSGGLKTHVRSQVMILGIENLRPRTLAHELGHLLGFSDCYLRTVTAQGPGGILGLASLEWDNPVYPDDLMCDDQIGFPRAEVW